MSPSRFHIGGDAVAPAWKFLRKADSQTAIWKEYAAEVKDGQALEIKFDNMLRHNHSHVCAIEILPY